MDDVKQFTITATQVAKKHRIPLRRAALYLVINKLSEADGRDYLRYAHRKITAAELQRCYDINAAEVGRKPLIAPVRAKRKSPSAE
jgi:hypothetical protein